MYFNDMLVICYLQPVGFVTFHTRAGAEAAKQDLQVGTKIHPYIIPALLISNIHTCSHASCSSPICFIIPFHLIILIILFEKTPRHALITT